LKNPSDILAFTAAADALLPQYWSVRDMSRILGPMIGAMENMDWIANVIFGATTLALVIIVTLLVLLFLRDRKQEIGIYLSLGARKSAILLQIITEVLSVSVIALLLSLVTGHLFSNVISTNLMENNLIQEQSDITLNGADPDNFIPMTLIAFNPGPLTVEELLQAYDVSFSIQTALNFLAISVVLISLTTILPVLNTLRLKPKDVLLK